MIEAGATTVNVPDTVGYTTPIEIAERFAWLRANVRGADSVVFSAHCHDDLGMAVANSLAAISAGARQVECTINGIGERAGNAALEEIVMALRVRSDRFAGLGTRASARKRLHATARLLAQITGQPIARNKAIIGENAFAHESGIHQHGMLKHRGTYEIMHAEDVGFARSQLVLGKHSGRHALRERLSMLGHELDEAALDEVFVQFKTLADRKREVFDADIEALAVGRDPEAAGPWHLSHLHATSHVDASASASVRLTHDDGRVVSEAAIGDGPVDAVLRAVSRAVGHEFAVEEFHIRALSEGGDAQGQAAISVSHEGRELRGQAVSTDIVEAAAKAILEIANRIEHVAAARPDRTYRHRPLRNFRMSHSSPDLAQRPTQTLGRGDRPRQRARAALRFLGVRGRAGLCDARRGRLISASPTTPVACSSRRGSTRSTSATAKPRSTPPAWI